MNPTLRDQLNQWKKDKATVEKERKRNSKKKNCYQKQLKRYQKQEKRTETFSTRDVMDLMGTNRQILTRGKGGAYRQK
ncbi:hypothetical protein Q8G31_23930 [Priestia megaterium]|uniref:hypothetical protein n=1 Tax=Priestia megaterium TaxID=1404 RepID=UPI00272F4FB2|nr:hypothetical protein [Priestia megaterium]MDP1383026.1 hypothetical protein [Priestia megaterium]MDP1426928.1 hypothetical protein [Priestia megaterium]